MPRCEPSVDGVQDQTFNADAIESIDLMDTSWARDIDLGQVAPDDVNAHEDLPGFSERRPDGRADLKVALSHLAGSDTGPDVNIAAVVCAVWDA